MTTHHAPRRDLAGSYANMPADVVEVTPLLEWMHERWGCTCEALEVVRVQRADGSSGPYVVHQDGCAVVRERLVATN